jgi:hypothetical protein
LFDRPLDPTQIEDVHALGYDYFGAFNAAEDVIQRAYAQRTQYVKYL